MLFMKLDLGAVLRKESGRDSPKIVLSVGNPLIMKEMARHTSEAPGRSHMRRRAFGV